MPGWRLRSVRGGKKPWINLDSGLLDPQMNGRTLPCQRIPDRLIQKYIWERIMPRTGRPRSFDRSAAVTTAMHLFWEHGYEGVSLDQLRREMGGISSASFYGAFRSKELLYREALSDYLTTHGRVTTLLRDETLTPRGRIEQALRQSARMQTELGHPSGCMVAFSAMICSEQTKAIKELTASERQANRDAITECVQSAIASGELRAQTDAIGLAHLFDGLLLGISFMARDGVTSTAIDAAITSSLAAWDANIFER
jgi:TetR/AcrR family transcriptional repressor for divergent bdcA